MMDKAQLLAWVQSLPDNLQVHDFQLRRDTVREQPWRVVLDEKPICLHEQKVDYRFDMVIEFRDTFRGEFRRTYENPEGMFHNVRRVA